MSGGSQQRATMRVGYGSAVVTPEPGLQMAGFLGERLAEGVHDDLMAKALYLGTGTGAGMLLIEVDTLDVDRMFVDEVRLGISREVGISPERCLVAATHTHSGPWGLAHGEVPGASGVSDAFNGPLFNRTIRGCVAAAVAAYRDAHEASATWGRVPLLEPVCGNRRVQCEEHAEMAVLELRGDHGALVAYNLDCHPTVLHEENRLYSADFPGVVARALPQLVPDVEAVMFLNGAAGDMSTRFYRRDSGFSEVERIGGVVAKSLAEDLGTLRELQVPVVERARDVPLQLKLKDFPSRQELDAALTEARKKLDRAIVDHVPNLRPLQSAVEGLTFAVGATERMRGVSSIESRLSLARCGNLLFAGIPGELFSSLGAAIRSAFPGYEVLVVGYCGDYVGYIPDAEAYLEGGYEASATFIAQGEGEHVRDAAIDGLRSLLV